MRKPPGVCRLSVEAIAVLDEEPQGPVQSSPRRPAVTRALQRESSCQEGPGAESTENPGPLAAEGRNESDRSRRDARWSRA